MRALSVLLAGLVLLGLVQAGTFTASAQPPTACTVEYVIRTQWNVGMTVDLRVTNHGPAVTGGWTLEFDFPGNQQITQSWNGRHTQTGQHVSIVNESWNASIPQNGVVTPGFNASFSGTNQNPTQFRVSGTLCTGPGGTTTTTTTTTSTTTTTTSTTTTTTVPQNPPPTVSLTSPSPGATFTAPATVPLAANASDSNGTVTRVDFFVGNATTPVGSDTSSPYTFSWTNVAAGSYSLTAVATDNQGASTRSAPVGITVTPPNQPTVIVTPPAITVPENGTNTFQVRLSAAPATASVTVATSRTAGDTSLTVSAGASLTFTQANFGTNQTVTIAAAEDTDQASDSATFTSAATGYTSATVTATEVDNDGTANGEYAQRFLNLYNEIKNPANGYFSSHGIPYHSVETLIVEAPDYGHVTTSEAFSYLIWLEAQYGRITRDWAPFNNAWNLTERYIIPAAADQPTNGFYNPSSPATFIPEQDLPSQYPSPLNSGVTAGQDPIANELQSTYGNRNIYGMHWLLDVDNWYGYGRCGDRTTSPAYINTFQRGSQESVWETVPHPSCDNFTPGLGGPNGFLPLFTLDSSYARQWRYTNAPDADARAVQDTFWALRWATEQGQASAISASVAKAAKMGDFLRYSLFDKYFKQIGCTSQQCPAGTGKNSAHYLLSWYYAWGGANDSSAGWAWRIGSSGTHQGYQNPLAAFALSPAGPAALRPLSPTAAADWGTSLTRQLQFYRWLQSAEGGIAGGAANGWNGRYDPPPAGLPTFFGMAYDFQPVWHDPPSNRWFGFQAWSMERVAEYYNVTGNAQAKQILDAWVPWVITNTQLNADGTYAIPNDLEWSGTPSASFSSATGTPAANPGLHVTVVNRTNDLGVAGSLAKTLLYYSARANHQASHDLGKALIDRIWTLYGPDPRGVGVPEARSDYNRFDDPVFVPSNFTGTMANGDPINSSSTFISLRSKYRQDPAWPQVQSYLNGGSAPTFTYHRFWAQVDVATAMAVYDELF